MQVRRQKSKQMQMLAKKQELRSNVFKFLLSFAVVLVLGFVCFSTTAHAASVTVDLGNGTAGPDSGVLDILLLFAILALLPSMLIMMTSFMRIIIVLSFLRSAMGTQQSPPNQVLIGIALFLTLFIMNPVLQEINTNAYQPYRNGEITRTEAMEQAALPVKRFMLRQTKEQELGFFLSVSGNQDALENQTSDNPEALTDLSLSVIVPSFITSELKRAFTMGFYIFIPFLIIDLVVSSTLMSMGMVMLPPTTISLPFKVMLFVLVDGWNLLFGTFINGFR